MYRHFENTLEILKTNSHLREIRNIENKNEKYIWFNGKKLLNLSSNNYLGFADNKEITKAFLETVGSTYSLGSASARLLTGNLPIYNELENLLCNLFNKEKSLLFNRYVEELHCGSASIIKTFLLSFNAKYAAKLQTNVVFPTPPLLLNIAIIFTNYTSHNILFINSF